MSHFAVLVITPTKPTQEELTKILQPWHEYECTGIDDEYVVDVDVTDDILANYKEHAKKGYSLEAFAESWSGAIKKGDRFYRHTNPSAKWDWWQLGGRWSGFLAPGYDPETDPDNIEVCNLCAGTGKRNDALGKKHRLQDPAYTCNGCDGKGRTAKWPTQWVNKGNQIRVGDLELGEVRRIASEKAAEQWDKFHAALGDRTFPDWETLVDQKGIEEARKIYHDNPGVVAVKEAGFHGMFDPYERYMVPREQFIQRAEAAAFQTYAVVKDGKWYEKGEMGWWGISSNEKEPEVWSSHFAKLLADLPKDYWLSIIDCHI